jgi:hypothetical protein
MPCDLRLSIERAEYSRGEPIWIKISATSTGAGEVKFPTGITTDIRLDLKCDGKSVAPSRLVALDELAESRMTRGGGVLLPLGKTISTNLCLSIFADVSTHGEYELSATVVVGTGGVPTPVRSNLIKFKINPDGGCTGWDLK